jgi:lipocalin
MHKRTVLVMLSTILVASLLSCATAETKDSPLETVPSLDIPSYMGRWYEIARYPHGFEKNLVGAVADYTLRSDGKVSVVNSAFKKTLDGKYTQVKAVARRIDDSFPGRLKVKFFGLFNSDYLVFALDREAYQWALVGDDSRKYLWILSRTAEISPQLLEQLKALATEAGYDMTKLYYVPQKVRE